MKISKSDQALCILLEGNRRQGEKIHHRIQIPGGHIEVVRAVDGDSPDYWAHVSINHPRKGQFIPGETVAGELVDARMDITGKNSTDVDLGDFGGKEVYHIAFRIRPDWDQTRATESFTKRRGR